jgi:hypothetical protein
MLIPDEDPGESQNTIASDEPVSRHCAVSRTAYCTYRQPGIVGYPCSCSGYRGRFELLTR